MSNATSYCRICGDDTSEAELDFCGGMCSDCLEQIKTESVRWLIALRLEKLDPGQLREVDELINHLTGAVRQSGKFVGVATAELPESCDDQAEEWA
jgi:hypothetical protein